MELKFYNKKQIAEKTCLSARTIDNLVADGKIPSFKVGARRLFDLEDVLEALKSGAAAPTKERK